MEYIIHSKACGMQLQMSIIRNGNMLDPHGRMQPNHKHFQSLFHCLLLQNMWTWDGTTQTTCPNLQSRPQAVFSLVPTMRIPVDTNDIVQYLNLCLLHWTVVKILACKSFLMQLMLQVRNLITVRVRSKEDWACCNANHPQNRSIFLTQSARWAAGLSLRW